MYFRLKDKDMVQFLTASALLMGSILHVPILMVTFWFLALVPVANMTRYSTRYVSKCLSVLSVFMQTLLEFQLKRVHRNSFFSYECVTPVVDTVFSFTVFCFQLQIHAVKYVLFAWDIKSKNKKSLGHCLLSEISEVTSVLMDPHE